MRKSYKYLASVAGFVILILAVLVFARIRDGSKISDSQQDLMREVERQWPGVIWAVHSELPMGLWKGADERDFSLVKSPPSPDEPGIRSFDEGPLVRGWYREHSAPAPDFVIYWQTPCGELLLRIAILSSGARSEEEKKAVWRQTMTDLGEIAENLCVASLGT